MTQVKKLESVLKAKEGLVLQEKVFLLIANLMLKALQLIQEVLYQLLGNLLTMQHQDNTNMRTIQMLQTAAVMDNISQ